MPDGSFLKHPLRFLAWLTFLTLVLLVGIRPVQAAQPTWGEEQRLLATAWTLVDKAYVDPTFHDQNWWSVRQTLLRQPLPDRQSTYQAIEGMLASLDDPFTRFLDREHYRSLQTSTAGELSGVGLQIVVDPSDRLTIIAPIEGSPAERAGLRTNDRIVAIDGNETQGLSLDAAAEKMRGRTGHPVTLSIERGSDRFDIKLVREAIAINPVHSKIVPYHQKSVAYIRLNQFNGNAVSEMADAIHKAETEQVMGYVLDLRSNPGGLLQAAIEIAQMWLGKGDIVLITDRNGVQDVISSSPQVLTQAPLVVLVDQGSASASEVLAGALQDNHRAVLVGTRTFGKGLIQSLFDLPDGSGMAITTARYVTPSGRDIHRHGIEPDVLAQIPDDHVALTRQTVATESDPQFQKALETLERHRPA